MFLVPTSFSDSFLIDNKKFTDDRGFFSECFVNKELSEKLGYPINFVQVNESVSNKNVLRGMHFQNPNPQGKFIKIVSGKVFDVIVDLRKNSKTYLKHQGFYLGNNEKFSCLWIPEGFAHGFLSLEDNTHVIYFCTNYYASKSEHCILYNDKTLDINWPFIETPIVSKKDSMGLSLVDAQSFLF